MIKEKILKEMNEGGMWWINSRDITKDKEFTHRLMTDKTEVEELIDFTLEEVIKIINNLQAKELKEKGGRYAMRINAEELKGKLK